MRKSDCLGSNFSNVWKRPKDRTNANPMDLWHLIPVLRSLKPETVHWTVSWTGVTQPHGAGATHS